MGKKRKDIKSIFSEALEKRTAKERAAYLDRVCGDDSDLRAEFESLLKEHDEAGSFLKSLPGGIGGTLDAPPLTEGPGTRIGRYKLLQLIGEGGFGVVYMAEQEKPIRRRVALKIIKLGMDTKQVIARFEAERQALAMMDHPNIARVFDAGATDTGRPYFVMELVKGIPITEYCDKNNLDTHQRLDLFIDVCKAVQHAHQKGIIHRDIKPSNVMITLHDGKPVPKIIDFGIAKATQHRLTEKTLFTEYRQLIGTPEYMSPEQAEMSGLDVDTRSDIYSLGVLLYELLTGTTPFEAEKLRSAAYDEIRRIICEDEPPKPSTRLSTLGDALSDVAKHRQVQPDQLCKIVRGDLDWVVMRALEKDRTRRYETANEFAGDIERHLGDEPVVAGPPSTIYRLRKFVRRNRALVTGVAAVLVVLAVGIVVSTIFAIGQARARAQADKARSVAEEARSAEAQQRQVAEQARDKEAIARNAEAQQRQIAEEETKRAKELAETQRKQLYFNNITLADVAYRNSNIPRVGELLDSCPEDLRGWEWHRLNHISDQALMTLRGHEREVGPVSFSPDGGKIISSSLDSTVKVWDAETGTELRTLRGHEGRVGGRFSPDGRQIISWGVDDKTIKLWDSSNGTELMTLRGYVGPLLWKRAGGVGARFSPDGTRIVSWDVNAKAIKVWDAATGVEIVTLPEYKEHIWSVSFSPDGKRIVSGSFEGTIKIWDTSTGAELMTLEAHAGCVASVSFSPDGKHIVSGSIDMTIKVWDVSTGAEVMTLRGHTEGVASVSFSPVGKHIVSGSRDRTIKVWDWATGDEPITLRGHISGIHAVVFSPDGKRIVSGSMDKTVKVWEVAIDRERMILADYQAGRGEGCVAFSPDGTRIISIIPPDGTIRIWDVATGSELMTLSGQKHGFLSAAFSPDGEKIASGEYYDNTVKVWNAATGIELMTLRGHNGWILSVAFSPDSKRIVSSSMEDKTIKVWDAATSAELVSFRHEDFVTSVIFSLDGERIVAGSMDNTVRVWDSATGAELMTLRGYTSGIRAVVFSPDGKHIVSGSENGTIKVWCAVSGKELISIYGHASRIFSVAFSPDGKRIISGSRDGTLKLWDAATGVEVMTLSGGYGSAMFSPDGKTIAFGTTLLESAAPPNGYGPRRTGTAARKVVDELYKETGFYSEVIDKLRDDKALDEPVRKVALQIANSRLWEDAGKLEEQSREVVSLPGRHIDIYRGALEKAEKANQLHPNYPFVLTTLGVAQYRVGAYEDALEVLNRSEKIIADLVVFGNPLLEPEPGNAAFIAMALHQLGRDEDAQAALDRLRDLCKDRQFAEDKTAQAQAFLEEAEKLLSSRKE